VFFLVAVSALGYATHRWIQIGRSAIVPPLPGFRDVARESGIDFHMSFLPSEQGENFRFNLYDHGSGVAVADYDGDGNDDLLLLINLVQMHSIGTGGTALLTT
jgi:hypothetical protein